MIICVDLSSGGPVCGRINPENIGLYQAAHQTIDTNDAAVSIGHLNHYRISSSNPRQRDAGIFPLTKIRLYYLGVTKMSRKAPQAGGLGATKGRFPPIPSSSNLLWSHPNKKHTDRPVSMCFRIIFNRFAISLFWPRLVITLVQGLDFLDLRRRPSSGKLRLQPDI